MSKSSFSNGQFKWSSFLRLFIIVARQSNAELAESYTVMPK